MWGNASSHEKCRLRGFGTLNLYSHLMLEDSVANNTAYQSWCLPSVDWWTSRINPSLGLLRPGMLSCERKRDWFLPWWIAEMHLNKRINMAALCMVNTLNLESFRINGPKRVFTGIFLDPLVIASQWLCLTTERIYKCWKRKMATDNST